MNTENKNSSKKGSFAILALTRLALLAGPEAVALKTLSHNPLACILMCVGILIVWLSIDAGPFRAEEAAKPVKVVSALNRKNVKLSTLQNLSQVTVRVLIFAMIFQSRLTHI